jgi:hypothetical protein
MQKTKKVEYGITITKPWSAEMYAHNEAVAEIVRELATAKWNAAITAFQESCGEAFMADTDWSTIDPETDYMQRKICCYGFGQGYSVAQVHAEVTEEIEAAPFYRLYAIAKALGLDLEQGFVGF